MTDGVQSTSLLHTATLEWIERFAPYGVIATDRELRVRIWNHWMEQHSGISSEKAVGAKLTELCPELQKRRFIGQFERALQGEVSVVSTALHGWVLQMPTTVREAASPFMKQTGRIAPLVTGDKVHGSLIFLEDVTQREWNAEILRRQHAREEVVAWALAQLMKAEEPRRIVREVFLKVAEHLDFDAYLLHLFNPETNLFVLDASGGVDPEKEKIVRELPAQSIPWLSEAVEGLAIVREHVKHSQEPLLGKGRELGFSAYVVMPLMLGSTVLGLLTFATRTREMIVQHETELLTTITHYISIALNREKTNRELRSAQKKLNEHAQELEKNVAERTASLKQIIAELQTFSYTIAHDLRAPIRAVKGYCDVLLEDYCEGLPADGSAIVHRLSNAATQMDNLTRDLLEFSKVSRQDLTLTAVDLGEVVTEAVLLGGARISSATEIKFPLHTVVANRTLVAQSVANLLQNAVKFCKPGMPPSVTIWSELASLPDPEKAPGPTVHHFSPARYRNETDPPAPKTPPAGVGVRLWVKDNGIGISSQAQAKVFGIFERGDRANEYEGTGIGLAIVARAMERMGGSCGVESSINEGSRFWLEFAACSPMPHER